MAIQTANLGTAPSGAGGDTFRSAATKFNENFSNPQHAASRLVGTQAGNVMEVGAFGMGGNQDDLGSTLDSVSEPTKFGWLKPNDQWNPIPGSYLVGVSIRGGGVVAAQLLLKGFGGNGAWIRSQSSSSSWGVAIEILTQGNTTTDSNGFIKRASPIVKLFADKIDLNDEAKQQDISFEKLGVGDYLIKGSTGFAQEGWYVETPKDANGNLLVAVVYEQLENGDISVKTYDYMLNKKGRIVADTETPLDIPENRWIDIRLQALPPIEYEIPTSKTPADFQPTGIAQAVATVMESYHDPE